MLEYRVNWQFVPVATAVLETDGRSTGLQVRSTGVANWLYPVDSHMTGLLDDTGERSLHYTRRANEGRGGRYKRDIEVVFDWREGHAVYSNFGEAEQPLQLDREVLDPLSMLVWFKDRELEPDSVIELHWSDGREVKTQHIAVSGPEWIEVPAGRYPAYRLVPQGKDLGGAFKDSEDPTLTIWISQERPRIPLQAESRLRVGRFNVQLLTPTPHDSRIEGTESEAIRPRRVR